MKHFLILLVATLSLQPLALAHSNSITPIEQQDVPEFEPQKLKSAVLLKWGGFTVACIGGAALSVPLAAVGGLVGLVGTIAQDVHTVRLGNSFTNLAADDSGGAKEYWESVHGEAAGFDPTAVQVGSSGTYEASKKESYPFTVIEIQDESDDDKIIRIEYTEASGETKQKLTKASNSRLTFKR